MPFGSLWLQVIVSAVAVFLASSVLHMVLKYHKSDHRPLPNEAVVREALAGEMPAPGMYFTPHCTDMKQLKEPAVMEKFEKGPVAIITMLKPGPVAMGKSLAQWFGFCVLVSFVTAYVARHALQPGDEGLLVMRITGTVAFATYALSQVSDSIWKGQPWGNTCRFMIDGGVYALLTGATFMLMWPAA